MIERLTVDEFTENLVNARSSFHESFYRADPAPGISAFRVEFQCRIEPVSFDKKTNVDYIFL